MTVSTPFGAAPDTLTRPGEWADRAACAGQLDLMFPERRDPAGWTDALVTCRRCPVRRECLDAALAEEVTCGVRDRHGVRGGLTPRQRWVIAEERGIRPARSRDAA